MRRYMTEQDNCYTPKELVDYFGKFDYDPATTQEQANYLKIQNYDTKETNGLLNNWNFNKVWLNPPFSYKFEFLEKAINEYTKYHNEIYILFPIESMTTKKWYDIMKNTKFKLYIPNFRIGFIVNNKRYSRGAFGIVIIKLQDTYDIEIINKDDILDKENKYDNEQCRI